MNKLTPFGRLYLGSVFVLDGMKMVKVDKMHSVMESNWEEVHIVYPGELCMLIGKVKDEDVRWNEHKSIVESPKCLMN